MGSGGRPPSPIVHGTYAGYQKHRKRGQPACDPCTEANGTYRRDYYATQVAARERMQRKNAARSRALHRLGAEHPARLKELLREEMTRAEAPV